MEAHEVPIRTEYIRLDQFLKLAGAVLSGGEAKERILQGEALLNGEPCLQRGRKLRPGDAVTLEGCSYLVTEGEPL
ncbi:MAG: RNA-binding S4 domain-containing protein [Oscillospiraceae bacterium]|jgi:ribosome-associated protein|nr:RNA-binding S4 domain-containing protein [Oscillospiraceae bacterium]